MPAEYGSPEEFVQQTNRAAEDPNLLLAQIKEREGNERYRSMALAAAADAGAGVGRTITVPASYDRTTVEKTTFDPVQFDAYLTAAMKFLKTGSAR